MTQSREEKSQEIQEQFNEKQSFIKQKIQEMDLLLNNDEQFIQLKLNVKKIFDELQHMDDQDKLVIIKQLEKIFTLPVKKLPQLATDIENTFAKKSSQALNASLAFNNCMLHITNILLGFSIMMTIAGGLVAGASAMILANTCGAGPLITFLTGTFLAGVAVAGVGALLGGLSYVANQYFLEKTQTANSSQHETTNLSERVEMKNNLLNVNKFKQAIETIAKREDVTPETGLNPSVK